MKVMASCGSSSQYGSTRLPKIVRLLCILRLQKRGGKPAFARGLHIKDPPTSSAVRVFEVPQKRVAALHDRVKRFLGGLVAGQKLLELLVDDVADLDVVAEPQALGVRRRLVQRALLDGD